MAEWNIFKRVLKNRRLDNAEQSAIHEIGLDDVDLNSDEKSIDWNEELPALINPTIKNFRLCYEKSDLVKGIIEDLVIKSISGWELEADENAPKGALEYIQEESEDDELDSLQPYHNAVLEAIGEIQHLDNFQSLTIEGLEYSKRDKAISKLLEMFKLKGRSVNHEECVFFRVSDIKGAYSNIKAFKNIDDVGALLNKLYDKGFINKLDFYDNKRQNIYYLTSKCEEITSPIEITEDDIVEAQNFLIYQGVYEADKEEDKSNKS